MYPFKPAKPFIDLGKTFDIPTATPVLSQRDAARRVQQQQDRGCPVNEREKQLQQMSQQPQM